MIVQKLFKGLKIHVRVIVPTRLHARWTKRVRIEKQVYIYTVNKNVLVNAKVDHGKFENVENMCIAKYTIYTERHFVCQKTLGLVSLRIVRLSLSE